MKIKYESVTGDYFVEVEVDAKTEAFILETDHNLRKQERNNKIHNTQLSTFEYEDASYFTDKSDEIPHIADRLTIESALEKLPEGQRRLIKQVYFDGLSLADISRLEGINKSNATRRHDRAIENLKKILSRGGN